MKEAMSKELEEIWKQIENIKKEIQIRKSYQI